MLRFQQLLQNYCLVARAFTLSFSDLSIRMLSTEVACRLAAHLFEVVSYLLVTCLLFFTYLFVVLFPTSGCILVPGFDVSGHHF